MKFKIRNNLSSKKAILITLWINILIKGIVVGNNNNKLNNKFKITIIATTKIKLLIIIMVIIIKGRAFKAL